MRLAPASVIANRYEIVEKLGIGGMAVVYKAKDKMLDRFVTFKVLKEEHLQDPEVSLNFETEAKAAARLNHQNIVRVFDTGNEENVHYIVMEYIDGNTIKELIRERTPERKFTETEALGVSMQIAKALAHAHENNVVHRDIKPQNILITTDGDVKVTDFGIALRKTHSDTTIAKESMGSVHYSSPEQARGRFVDGRSDIYSLGIVMFEMITGRLPFEGDTSVTVALKHVNDPLPEISNLVPETSEKFINIIKKCTAKLANQRYNNVYELVDDLQRLFEAKSRSDEEYDDYIDYTDYEDEEALENPTIKLGANLSDYEDGYGYNNEEDEDKMIKALGGTIRSSGKNSENKANGIAKRSTSHPYQSAPPKKGNFMKSQNLKIAAIASVFVLTFVAIVIIIFLLNRNSSAEQIMPNIIGMNQYEIMELFEDYEIDIHFREYPNEDVEAGLAFSQNINQGTVIEPGAELIINISVGQVLISVPNLIGLPLSQALALMEEEYPYLSFQPLQENHATVPIGMIFSQEPDYGELVSHGEVIFGYVSLGGATDEEVIVLNFVGRLESELARLVEEAELTLGTVSTTSSEMPEGVVITQTVPPGTSVSPGHIIHFVVSTGPAQVAEPEPEPEPEIVPESEPGEEPVSEIVLDPPTDEIQVTPVFLPILISLPPIADGQETVFISAILSTQAGGNQPIVTGDFSVWDFPLPVTITGNGPATVMIFADNVFVDEQNFYLE